MGRKKKLREEIKQVIYISGYRYLYVPDNPNCMKNGYMAEHRIVMEKKLGRPLLPGEIVHHVDEDILNNDPQNLRITNKKGHARIHNQMWAHKYKTTFNRKTAGKPKKKKRTIFITTRRNINGRK